MKAKTSKQSAKFRQYKSSNQILTNQSFENLSDRKKTQIKHESYQNLFENRYSPGQRMTIINKKKPIGLTRAKTMFVKNVNIQKNCIQECNSDEEDEANNYENQSQKKNKNQLKDYQQSITNKYFNWRFFKSNSFNNLVQTRNNQKDYNFSQNNNGNFESEQRSKKQEQLGGISPKIDDSLKLDDIQSSYVMKNENKRDQIYSANQKNQGQQKISIQNKNYQINKQQYFDVIFNTLKMLTQKINKIQVLPIKVYLLEFIKVIKNKLLNQINSSHQVMSIPQTKILYLQRVMNQIVITQRFRNQNMISKKIFQ
ncbi:hypothetical protein ABPG72_008405 [Tetrahymena utriculariae]